ncbi:GNAT family acetyltransferase [Legionella gratiana]|uniref:GNAT family acetyltransferase n=1 Tax=Legionella gratiana TaxID=45066 RepID=A0A378J862_9GAMM|nr:GNAT family N-acetyltransferase [Legionella gratiana]KTD10627.1 GNAT family acetyltransferase [Legionella gratiana]STX43566.1 GNAT family acetyltransferase [Legionella gratiana]
MENYLIKTKHLGIRLIRKDDDKYLKLIERDPEVKEFFPEGLLSDKEIKDGINKCLAIYKEKHLPCLIIFKRFTDEFVGESYFNQLETGEIKVGYLLHQKFWNKGYATEILKALLNWAKEHIDTDYIIAYADKNNTASFRVMQKCGMKYYKKGRYRDMDCYFYRIRNQ